MNFYILILLFSISCTKTINLSEGFQKLLVEAASDRLNYNISYDGRYINIPYPNGDIPSNIGVCTDLVIRSFRQVNIDLQELVHEDMKRNYDIYPSKRIWGLKSPDTNIDHRRVPNLQTFFTRMGSSLVITKEAQNYKPGDIITWDISGRSPWHIGIVSDKISNITGNPLIIHNMGRGPIINDMLFKFKITGHYRYSGKN